MFAASQWPVALAFLLALPAAGTPAGHSDKLASIEKAEAIVVGKLEERREGYRRSLAIAHRHLRARRGRPGLARARVWLRAALVQRSEVWQRLDKEVRALEAARRTLTHQSGGSSPAIELGWPVAGTVSSPFGSYRHRASGAELVHQGIEITSLRGDVVRSPVTGRVRFVGPIRGLGSAVVIAADRDLYCVLGGVIATADEVGQFVELGDVIGVAAGSGVFLALRRTSGGQVAFDPEPLLPPHQ